MRRHLKKLLGRLRGCPEILPSPVLPETHYGVEYVRHNIPDRLPARSVYPANVTIRNTGSMTWISAHPDEGRGVALYLRLGDEIVATYLLPRDLPPCGEVTFRFPINVPSARGEVSICLEMVEFHVALFRDLGVSPLEIQLTVDPPLEDPQDNAWATALSHNPWHFQPTRGISRGTQGRRYPVIASRAKGCRLWDASGREYIDYIMGWGSTLLGYADDRIQQAIIDAVKLTAPVIPYPHELEMEVTRMLCEDFPSAEMAIFGKNGSDVCTLAARISRIMTGKKTILYSGYHGWQDFWVEQMGFGLSGVPDRPAPLIHRFSYNDKEDFFRLYDRYRNDLAAVMLEPAGPLGSDDTWSETDSNRGFLETVAGAARDAGAILVFDEIITGYRFPQGSVQKANGVTPDMTCLGKALASGMPLAALVGRADLMLPAMPKTRYAPTFKGEVYSLAAARAAIEIYRSEPVAEHVWDYGLRLKQGINGICRQKGIAAGCIGTPFRMLTVFHDQDPVLLSLKKTLYCQELLANGLSTYNGIMLPSYSHGEAVLEKTLSIIGHALQSVAEAESQCDYSDRLEIPPIADIE